MESNDFNQIDSNHLSTKSINMISVDRLPHSLTITFFYGNQIERPSL
jgi:hypothetical protein